MRIWLLSRVLGWTGRRIAAEVGVSQPTVVRVLERLREDPPTDQEMQDFVTVASSSSSSSTPPHGMPELKETPKPVKPAMTPMSVALIFAVVAITLAIVAVLAVLAYAILQR